MAMNDKELMEALVAVRGIGRWTVEMFMASALTLGLNQRLTSVL